VSNWEARSHPRVEIRASPKEHAKIWVGQTLAFFGSSNLTEGGLGLNRELMQVSDESQRITSLTSEADVFLSSSDALAIP
jgi:hypothetical protein